MRTGWIVGIVMIYIAMAYFGITAEMGSSLGASPLATIDTLMKPEFTNFEVGLSTLITNVGTYILAFLQIVFLWFPTLWSGTWIWFYFFVILPMVVGMTLGLVMVMRGVGST